MIDMPDSTDSRLQKHKTNIQLTLIPERLLFDHVVGGGVYNALTILYWYE
jgi:hypothetical protein